MKKRCAALVAILALMLALCGCGKAAALYGSWAQSPITANTADTLLTFYDNGTGTVTQGEKVTWLYYDVKGDTVTVTLNEVGAEATAYTFAAEDDVLTLTDESGAAVSFTRVVTEGEAQVTLVE